MSNTTVMQDAHKLFPTPAQLLELFLYDQDDPQIEVAFCGRPLTAKQAHYIIWLLAPGNAPQVRVALRPDVQPEITFEYEAFGLYCPSSTLPDDAELASLYEKPLVQYGPREPTIASRLATLLQTAHAQAKQT